MVFEWIRIALTKGQSFDNIILMVDVIFITAGC